MTTLEKMAEENVWRDLCQEVERVFSALAPRVGSVREVLSKKASPALLWIEPFDNAICCPSGSWTEDLAKIATVETGSVPADLGERAWAPIKQASIFRPILSGLQMAPNALNRYFGGATPIAASLAGGLVGAGLGYGAGWIGEKVLGDKIIEPGALRRRTALLGGAVGTLPGLWLGATGMRMASEDGRNPWASLAQPNVLFGARPPKGPEPPINQPSSVKVSSEFQKMADDDAGALAMPMVPVDSFNRVIWEDPLTPMPLRAATAALIQSASQSRGGAQVVSPLDISRIAVGMGSGLVSGLLVGRTLGALAGLTPEAQQGLQRIGMWSGVIRNVVPQAFGWGG